MNVFSPDLDSHRLIESLVESLSSIYADADDPGAVRRHAQTAINDAQRELRPSSGYCRCPECGSACDAGGPGALTIEVAHLTSKVQELENLLTPVEHD